MFLLVDLRPGEYSIGISPSSSGGAVTATAHRVELLGSLPTELHVPDPDADCFATSSDPVTYRLEGDAYLAQSAARPFYKAFTIDAFANGVLSWDGYDTTTIARVVDVPGVVVGYNDPETFPHDRSCFWLTE